MGWAWEVTTLSGVTVAEVRPRDATVTRRLNGSCTVELSLDASETRGLGTNRLIRGWRSPGGGGDRVLRVAGRVTGVSGSVGVDQLERVTLASAADGFGVLSHRAVQSGLTYAGVSPRDIVAGVVAAQNSRAATGLRVAAGVAGPPRDRTYEAGKNVAEIVTQLAEVDDGFWFRVDPVDDGAVFSELVLLYPSSGGASGAVLELGVGTRDNLASVEVNVTPPVNHVLAFGAGDGDAQLSLTVSDAGSIATHGLLDTVITHTDVSVPETLLQHARDALRPSEQRTLRVEVSSLMESAPRPWDDFDVGDLVSVHVRGGSPALSYSGSARVTAFTAEVDVDGVERLTGLDLEGV